MLNDKFADALIDLGVVSRDTLGGQWGTMDHDTSLKPLAGLTDD